MIDLSAHARESHRRDEPRTCPHCGKIILWKDYAGLATQAWHFRDVITAQCVISNTTREEIESPTMPNYFQKCGYCHHELIESDFH